MSTTPTPSDAREKLPKAKDFERAPKSLLIGLTGGIGTGKSRVSDLLEALGAAVECSDKIVRELQSPGGEGLRQIVATFGDEYLTEDGNLNRPKLGELVFGDERARQQLNLLIHPLVYGEYDRRTAEHRKNGVAVIVVDIPLLLEGRKAGTGSGAKLPFDYIAVVYATPETQLQRVMARDGLPEAQAQARIDSQMPIDEKRSYADFVIENNGDWAEAEAQTRALFARWLEEARS